MTRPIFCFARTFCPTLTVTESQDIQATLTVEFSSGCTESISTIVPVNIFAPPTLDDAWFSCTGQNVELNPNGSADFNYQWSAPGSASVNNANATNPMATLTETTTFFVTITNSTGTGTCQSVQEVTVEVPETILTMQPLPDVALCSEEDVTLTANTTGASAIQWSTDPDFTNIISSSKNDNNSHRFNFDSDVHINKNLYLTVRPSFDFNNSNNISIRDEESKNNLDELINSSNSLNSSESETKNFRTNFSLTQKMGKKGSFLKFRINGSANTRNGDNFTQSKTEIFGSNPSVLDRNQLSKTQNESSSINTNITYRLPLLANKLFLNFGVNLSNRKNENKKTTHDFDPVLQEFNLYNLDLSDDSKSLYASSSSNMSVTFRNKKWYSNIGVNYITNSQENIDNLRSHLSLKKEFNALNFSSRVRYNLTKKTHFTTHYNVRNSNPSLNQLNPFIDISNPLNIVTGNPDLESAKNHSFGIKFNSYNTQKKTSFYGNINASIQDNKVVSKTTILDDFVRYTSYTNVNGSYRVNFYTGFGKTYKFNTDTSLRINLNASANYSNAINFSNDILYTSKNTSFSPNVRFTFNWKNILEVSPRYRVSITKTDFDIDKFEDKEFVNHEALAKQKEEKPNRRLVGFELVEKGIPRKDYTILDESGNEIGRVTSGTMSPSTNKAIGLGYVKREFAKAGSKIWIQIRNKQVGAEVVKPPFYKA